MISSPERDASLQQIADFIPLAARYGWDRNNVRPGHAAVSRLSPAIRHRLVTEDEVAAAVMAKHVFPHVEKFVQEVYWRRYWKSWLSLRPQVWTDFLSSLEATQRGDGDSVVARGTRADLGNSVINHFARELVETGYLHNHARMWFAAWWIHQARLPWESGAAFFFQHLLDGDPAANTLSWRWVAGLQTPGKTYLARRANLEKYLDPKLRQSLADGLTDFEDPVPYLPHPAPPAPVTQPALPLSSIKPSLPTGLWIHEEDLSAETTSLGKLNFQAIIVTGQSAIWSKFGFPTAKQDWLKSALNDASQRASSHWKMESPLEITTDLASTLISWAHRHDILQIATLRPDVGPLNDLFPSLASALDAAGIHMAQVDRPRDLELRPLATGGFFRFWETMKKRGLLPDHLPQI